MRLKIILLAVFTSTLYLAACGGGYTNPYDGTWTAVYPVDFTSSITDTKMIQCGTTPGVLVIKDGAGTTEQTTQCITTIVPASGVAATGPFTETHRYIIGVSIEGTNVNSGKDVLNAIVNGVTFTGQCISTVSCSAVSGANSLSLTR